MDLHRPILLTTPDGTHSLINPTKDLSLEDKPAVDKISEQGEEEPESPNTEAIPDTEPVRTHESNGTGVATTPAGGVQFDSEQLQRGRSRIKRRSDFVAKNNENDSNSSRSRSRSFSRSRSRSRSRTASRIRDEEFLKWTVLRQDPSMRLHNYKMKYNHKTKRYVADDDDGGKVYDEEDEEDDDDEGSVKNEDEDEEEDEDEDEDEEDEEEEEEDDDDEESDEEQVSDIENDASINEQFNYDLGTKVLPNFCISINEVLESSTPWITRYESEPHDKQDDDINITELEGGYIRGVLTLSREGPSVNDQQEDSVTNEPKQESEPNEPIKETNDSYILYVDLTSESIYAITYVMGTLVKNGDTVYIVHWHSDRKDCVSDADITKNIVKLRNTVLHLFDCVNATIDNLDVVILSLTHPYPKHLLNEMINGLQPIALCCSLSMTLSGLQNFVCSVPTFIIRKKLKRAKKKGIFD